MNHSNESRKEKHEVFKSNVEEQKLSDVITKMQKLKVKEDKAHKLKSNSNKMIID